MAYKVRGPIVFHGLKDGRPVFTHGGRPPAARTAPITAAQHSTTPAATGATPPGNKPESNQYGGKCGRCTVWVEPGAGTRRRDTDGVWKTFHLDGTCTAPAVPVKKQEPYGFGVTIPIPVGAEIRPAIFTIGEAPRHVTVRIRRQAPDDTFRPGEDLVGFLTTGNRYESFANIDHTARTIKVWRRFEGREDLIAALRVLVEDPESVRTARLCIRCGLVLTHPDSDWLGPDCRKKMDI